MLASDTPARLRWWSLTTVAVAGVLLVALTATMAAVQDQVRVIGAVAAPRAATAADLYFGLSDLDAQVARLVLVHDDDRYAASQADALNAYRQRGDLIDAGLRAAGDHPAVLRLVTGLAVYRRQAWQALTVESRADALGFYTQATNTLHLTLLPIARELGDAARAQLEDAYAGKRRTETAGLVVLVLLGGGVTLLLAGLHIFLVRRFRRLVNPWLLAATGISVVLLVAAGAVLNMQQQRLGDARSDSLVPYLALSQARALSYDAAADTGRYLLSAGYRQGFDGKSATLTTGEGSLAALSGSAEVAERWLGYQRDHERIVGLADAGQRDAAVAALTGIRRGDAAFDFFYFDIAVGAVAEEHRAAYDRAVREADGLLTGWVVLPIIALGLVILLVPVGVRKRLAEFR